MFCTNCGTKLRDDASFCTNCGTPVKKRPVVEANPAEAVATPNAQPVQVAADPNPAEVVAAPNAQPVQVAAEANPAEAVATPNAQPVQVAAEANPAEAVATPNAQPVQAAAQAQQGTAQAYQPTPEAAPKKKNLGKILGLSIGIPVGVITLLTVAAVIIFFNFKDELFFLGGQPNVSQSSNGENGEINDRKDDSNNSGEDVPDDNKVDDEKDDTNGKEDTDGKNDVNQKPDVETSGAEAVRTLMIYMVGSDLETGSDYSDGGMATSDIYEMCAANLPENVNIVLECGGSENWEHESVPDGEVTRFKVEDGDIVKLENLGRTTMTCTGDLSSFITFAQTNFPAESYTLILWDHGGGIPVGFGCDELGDYYDTMCDYEIREELINAGVKFDAVIFDACNMCTLEMAMALDGFADYMVGAESYVNGTGIYYTDWLASLDGNAREFSEKIVQDYMKQNEIDGLMGSMSVIRLDYVDEVYDAYIDYMEEALDALDYGDYSSYFQARGNCGYYESNDSVDLITLANSYNNDYSTPLMNAVVNAVVYTDSDFVYGHGLMAYSPYEDYDLYDDGRKSFVELGYDSSIIDFYDGFISRKLAYLGEEYVDYYGGEWYVGDYSDEVEAAGGSASEYEMPLVAVDDLYYAVETDDEFWDSLYYVSQAVAVEIDEDTYLILGEDYNIELDDEGRIALVDPEYWTYVNGNLATYYCLDYYSEDDNSVWAQTGIIPVTVNDEDAYLYIYYDDENPYGVVQGYCLYDFQADEAISDDIYALSNDDEIDLVYQYYDSEGNVSYAPRQEPFLAGDLELTYDVVELEEYSTLGWYDIYDVYGNVYTTEAVYLGGRASIE